MSHLSREELIRWRDEGADADRERVVGHLAACDACGAAYTKLVWTAPPDDVAPRLDEAAIRARGHAVAAPRRLWPAAISRPVALAASLAAVAAAGALTFGPWRPWDRGDTEIRGSQLQPLAPVGFVSPPIEFRWASPIVAARFKVEVADELGRVLGVLDAERDRATDPSLSGRLVPGVTYRWTVTALDAGGAPLMRSPPREFVLSGAGG